jgi:uncharacterized repeat protein (TIGR04138 family)
MQVSPEVLQSIRTVQSKDQRYKTQAYLFVLSGLDNTLRKLGKTADTPKDDRQVTGQDLSRGIRDLAMQEFGPTAKMVLENWGMTETMDFGNIVYSLIDAGLMGKSETDSIDDFKEVFNFTETFVTNYPFKLNKVKR